MLNPSIRFLTSIFVIFLFISCNKKETLFTNIEPSKSNILFKNKLVNTVNLNILNYLYFYNGGGVSTGDLNNDGLIDIYFTANQSSDKLYLNTGEFNFKDITEVSGISNEFGWTTGVTTIDINNDGLLDIYICKVGDFQNIKGQNLLYVNQGIKDGIPIFKELANDYNLNISSFSTQSTFFDYDLDGDLDLFLLNHSVHPNRNYGKGTLRKKIDTLSGDRLYKNENGKFIDVSKESGIFQGKIGYGLGISVSDINFDGYPDIYIGNDFFENDYLYINQKDGTFKDIISTNRSALGHTSHFSMGNTIEDINNDGKPDIISLDMLPEDLSNYKTSGLEYGYPIYEAYLKNGYQPQFMQNTLHLNNGNNQFSETAHLSGISATEWSWSPLTADFDNDGLKDIYITNGIPGATNDMDFINFISNDKIQQQLGPNMSEENLELVNQIPKKKVKNYIYKNTGNATFKDVTDIWSDTKKSYSNGASYADLDNDGDLDIIVNNINEEAYLLKNNSEKLNPENNYLKVKFIGPKHNTQGIGAKIIAYSDGQKVFYENFKTKGYLSSVSSGIHLGLGNKTLDSLQVIWPNGQFETIQNAPLNSILVLKHNKAKDTYNYSNNSKSLLTNSPSLINFKHKDQTSIEFNRDPLIPYANTNKGPGLSVGDINNDGLEDILIGGAKGQESSLFIQNAEGNFNSKEYFKLKQESIREATDHLFIDVNNDDLKDIIIVYGGNEFKTGKSLQPDLYINKGDSFERDTIQFKNTALNASKIKSVDFNNDGFQDISISANTVPWKFGETPKQYLFLNNGKGHFNDVSNVLGLDFVEAGNVEDIIWIDINKDEFKDAIIVGKWMPIKIFINNKGESLTLQENNNLDFSNGWWNAVNVADFDKDGDLDIVAGNWGLNTRLKASKDKPMTLYNYDFDGNGKTDPIVTYFYKDEETLFASKDELVKQLPYINKEFLQYATFAKASIQDLFTQKKLNKASKKQAYSLASTYFENIGNGQFKAIELPFFAQISSVNDIQIDDYNNDGFLDIFLVGNDYEISTQLGKLDASHGCLFLNDKNGFFETLKDQNFNVSGPARQIEKIKINEETYYIVSINNDEPIFLKKND